MGGLRFDSMADMPAGMRELYAKKMLGSSTPPVSRADSPLSAERAKRKTAKYQNQKAERGGGFTLTARRKRGAMTSCC